MEAKNLISQHLVHPAAPVLLPKDSRNEISYDDFQHSFSLNISNSRTKPAELDFFDVFSASEIKTDEEIYEIKNK